MCVSGSADVLTYDQNIFKGTTQDQMTKLTTQIMHLNVCGFEFLWFRQSFKMSEYVSLLNSTPRLKPGIHYVVFALISPRFHSLNKLTLVEESQSQSADYSLQIPQKIIVYYGHSFRLFSFRRWFYPVGGYQSCLIDF